VGVVGAAGVVGGVTGSGSVYVPPVTVSLHEGRESAQLSFSTFISPSGLTPDFSDTPEANAIQQKSEFTL